MNRTFLAWIPRAAFAAAVTALALSASLARAAESISLVVDATKTSQKFLHARMDLAVKPGPLTLYYPKWIPGEHGPEGPISSLTGHSRGRHSS
jgi:hypothetical protein